MLIQRMQEKASRPPLISKNSRPKSSGLKYLNKVAEMPRFGKENRVDPEYVELERQYDQGDQPPKGYFNQSALSACSSQASTRQAPREVHLSLTNLAASHNLQQVEPKPVVNPLRASESNLGLFSFVLDQSPYMGQQSERRQRSSEPRSKSPFRTEDGNLSARSKYGRVYANNAEAATYQFLKDCHEIEAASHRHFTPRLAANSGQRMYN